MIALLLRLHPLIGSQLPPGGNGAEDDPFADGKGEGVNVPAGEIGALVAAHDPFSGGASLDRADAAVEKDVVRKTALAMEIVHTDAVEACQALLEL